MKNNHNFNPVWLTTSLELEEAVRYSIVNKEISHFLFVNDWDKLSKFYMGKLEELKHQGGMHDVFVISIFDVPNGLNIIKSCIKEFRETISTSPIQNYTSLPMMVRLHGAFPVCVSYSGSISAELGL